MLCIFVLGACWNFKAVRQCLETSLLTLPITSVALWCINSFIVETCAALYVSKYARSLDITYS